MGGVTSCSWNGLIGLDKYFTDKCAKKVLTDNIPYGVFEYLKMLPNYGTLYEIRSLELKLVSDQQVETKVFPIGDLIQLSQTSPHQFLSWHGKQIRGDQRHFLKSDLDSPVEDSPWYNKNKEEFQFWHKYINFCQTTVCLAQDLMDSLRIVLEKI